MDYLHLFCTRARDLERRFPALAARLADAGMLWVSWPAVRNSWSIRETSPDPGGLPRYPIKAVILIGFVLLVLQALSQIVKQVEIIRGGDTGAPDAEGADPAHEGHL